MTHSQKIFLQTLIKDYTAAGLTPVQIARAVFFLARDISPPTITDSALRGILRENNLPEYHQEIA